MGNCLVTKLKSSVDNQELSKIGEIKIHFDKVDTPSVNTNAISVRAVYDNLTCRVVNGYFTDSTFLQNLGTTKTITKWAEDILYISNTDANLFIPNKYENIGIIRYAGNEWERQNIVMDISQLSYMKYIANINVRGFNIQGAIDSLKPYEDYCELRTLDLTNCYNVTGSIDAFIRNYANVSTSDIELRLNGHTTFDLDNLQGNFIRNLWIFNCDKMFGTLSNLKSHLFVNTESLGNLVLGLNGIDCDGVTGALSDLSGYFFVGGSNNLQISIRSLKNVTGRIEDLCDDLHARGKTVGTLTFELKALTQTGITFNDSPITKDSYVATFTTSGYTIV